MSANFEDRAQAELRRGVLQISVLAILESTPTYGYDLLRKLGAVGLATEEGTLYPVLRRLQGDGLLASEWDTTGSRPRKYYRTTDEGLAVLSRLVAAWAQVNAALDRALAQAPDADDVLPTDARRTPDADGEPSRP